MNRIIVLIIVLFQLISAHSQDSTCRLSILPNIHLYNKTNSGLFNTKYNFAEKNDAYSEIIQLPVIAYSIGIRYQNLFGLFEFSKYNRTGFVSYGIYDIKLNYTSFGFEVWYDFLNKWKFPVKPLASIKTSYIQKNYYHYFTNSSGSFYVHSNEFNDKSTSVIFQIPMGIFINSKFLFLSLSYSLNIFAGIKGAINYKINYPFLPTDNSITIENYKGNSSSIQYKKPINVLSIRIGYNLKI